MALPYGTIKKQIFFCATASIPAAAGLTPHLYFLQQNTKPNTCYLVILCGDPPHRKDTMAEKHTKLEKKLPELNKLEGFFISIPHFSS